MSTQHRIRFICLISIVCIIIDQSTKWLAISHLKSQPVTSYLGDFFRLGYSENTGAFLSLGASLPPATRTLIFTGMVSVLLITFVVYVLKSQDLNRKAIFAAALIVSGGISNLIDRIFNNGAVIDFLNVGIGPVRTGIFNIADMAIMLGVFLFFFNQAEPSPSKAA